MGKCHVTMLWCEEINNLLDELDILVSFSKLIFLVSKSFFMIHVLIIISNLFYCINNIFIYFIEIQNANDIDLKPVPSRSTKFRSFTVCCPNGGDNDLSMVGASYFDNSITWYIMEVREDGLVLKTKRGDVVEHCPYEGIVNMTFSPKTKIICIWRRSEGLTQLKKYHTKKV